MTAMTRQREVFEGRPHSAAEHFRLLFWGGVLHIRRLVGAVDLERLPFVTRYLDELAGTGLESLPPAEAVRLWAAGLAAWEDAARVRLPLRDLRIAAGLDAYAMLLWFAIGVTEEDRRFGLLVEALSGIAGQHRPPAGLLGGEDGTPRARAAVAALLHAALVEHTDEVPPAEPGLRPCPAVWAAARGEPPAGWIRPESLPAPETLVLEPAVRARFGRLQALDRDERLAVVVTGPPASGRRTLLHALARSWGRGVLEPVDLDPRQLGPISTLLDAVPVLRLDPAPGQAVDLPTLPGMRGPVGIMLPRHATIGDDAGRPAITMALSVPDRETRRRHWREALGPAASEVSVAAAEHRLSAGTIRRIARLAVTGARLADRPGVTAEDINLAARTHRSGRLEALAVRVPASRGWVDIAAGAATTVELRLLERRCRLREELDAALPLGVARPGTGVRALFSGPSGTGKTLAARCLAGELGKDLYRLDLARVVDKYLGETEKNLDHVLRQAEALDVVLLVDEGDALLGRRTDVRSSNDRYANLETDYLLQRLEVHDGIVVVTTNAEQRIDDAFSRRLDVIIAFPAPAPAERHAVWQAHLPAGELDPEFLTEVAIRCELTGGQIRNAVLHACLLALDGGRPAVTTADVVAAVRREYAKSGAVCPLPDPAVGGG